MMKKDSSCAIWFRDAAVVSKDNPLSEITPELVRQVQERTLKVLKELEGQPRCICK